MELPAVVDQIANWIQDHSVAVWWLGGVSAATFVLTLIAIPFMVVRIPPDYFAHRHRQKTILVHRHPAWRALLLVSKNLIGVLFVIAGIVMLVLPGQGLLTILIGLMLIDFPGKYQIERWIVVKPPVLKAINYLRKRWDHPPIEVS